MNIRIFFSPDTPCTEADTLPPTSPQGRWIGLDPYSFLALFKLEFYGLCPELAAINLIMLYNWNYSYNKCPKSIKMRVKYYYIVEILYVEKQNNTVE